MMITLMLIMALAAIALLAVLPNIKQQILRDREEEMRHRGTAYMRAIQHFYKKFGRYPTKLEDLENTNNLRFLRKRYTDPMNRDPATGKEREFKFLHQQDVMLNSGPVLPGGLGRTGSPGCKALAECKQPWAALAGLAGAGATAGIGRANRSQQRYPILLRAAHPLGARRAAIRMRRIRPLPIQIGTSSNGFNGPTLGGGPILGVASASKAKSIRVYFKKDHYNDWLFIYTTQMVGGGLLIGPINPGMPSGGNMGGLTPGQMAAGAQGQGDPGKVDLDRADLAKAAWAKAGLGKVALGRADSDRDQTAANSRKLHRRLLSRRSRVRPSRAISAITGYS